MANPDESFVVKSITRKEIAENLTGHFESRGLTQTIQPDDPRLTSRICGEYATAYANYGDLGLSEDWNNDYYDSLNEQTLEKIGITLPEEEEDQS